MLPIGRGGNPHMSIKISIMPYPPENILLHFCTVSVSYRFSGDPRLRFTVDGKSIDL